MDRYMNIGGKMVRIGFWMQTPDKGVIWVSLTQD